MTKSSDENTFGSVTAFANKPVKIREITEPFKKSKFFHVLYTIVSLSRTQFGRYPGHPTKDDEFAEIIGLQCVQKRTLLQPSSTQPKLLPF